MTEDGDDADRDPPAADASDEPTPFDDRGADSVDDRGADSVDDDQADHDDGTSGPPAVDDRDAAGSPGSGREPLGNLRERVVDADGPRTPGASFPEGASASADGSDEADGDASGSADGVDAEETTAAPTVPETGREGPLGELAAGIDGRRERETPTDDALFDEVEVGEVDADELWSQVETDGPTVEPRGEREIREVEKRKYCSQCPYFSEPPEVACSHDGTDILKQVDMEHFEVADCPVVLEDERLEDVTTE